MPKPVILVSSCKRDQQNGANQAVRETWGARSRIPYFFILGQGAKQLNPDELFFDVGDAYLDLPHKTKQSLSWALNNGYTNAFRAFTDTFIDTERLLSSGFEKYDYTGNESEPYPGFTFAHGGPGYWLSRKGMKIVVDSPIDRKAFNSDQYEDQWSGRRLGLAGIKCVDDKRYSMGWSYDKEEPHLSLSSNNVISVHLSNQPGQYESDWMRQVHAERYGMAFKATKVRLKGCCCKYCVARAAAQAAAQVGLIRA